MVARDADPRTAETIHSAAEKFRNWGRWGADDQVGTLNYITMEHIRRAATLVRVGRAISLAMPFDDRGPQTGRANRFNPVHTMLMTGTDAVAGKQSFPHDFGVADDMVTMPLQCGTQWDGLSHIFDRGRMWNGYPADAVTSAGAAQNGIEHMSDRIVGRGVLLDIARHEGVDALADGFAITEQHLVAAIQAQGPTAEVGVGDIVLVRTGQLAASRADKWRGYAGGPAPGLSFSTAGWLHRTEIAALATDTWGVEVRPNELAGSFQPLHQVMVPNIGLPVGEMFDLDRLAAHCAERKTYDFMFVGSPLPFSRAVGAPVNPQAIV
jgi:kynurenine formamidase